MHVKRIVLFGLLGLFATALLGCYGMRPKTFVTSADPGWKIIEVRADKPYDEAWEDVVDVMAKKFDIELMSKTDGYLLTGWKYNIGTSQAGQSYGVRVSLKFSSDRKQLALKTIAVYRRYFGYDEFILSDLYNDISARVGRGIK